MTTFEIYARILRLIDESATPNLAKNHIEIFCLGQTKGKVLDALNLIQSENHVSTKRYNMAVWATELVNEKNPDNYVSKY